jgi:hypothetical protein
LLRIGTDIELRELLDEQRATFFHYRLSAELRLGGRACAVSEAEHLDSATRQIGGPVLAARTV